MKLQGLAILFVILILPLSIIIGEYASFQIETFRLERLYDSRLITATHDALKTYQINTFNDELSDIVNNKLETIEASATTFYNSLRSGFGMQGYTVEELQQYVPALVYTMYDGYYIYSPYTDVANITTETFEDEDASNDADVLEYKVDGAEMVYGFKPYVYYSCRYIIANADPEEASDFVINYALDNYITVQGIVNGEYVKKSGYLVTLAEGKDYEGLYREYDESTGIYTFYYSGQEILPEDVFEDDLVVQEENAEGEMVSTTKKYQYVKINGEKYYYEPAGDTNGDGVFDDQYFFHLVGGERVVQVGEYSDEFYQYINQMELNRSAINYYRSAYEFTTWINKNLGEDADASMQLKPKYAQIAEVQNPETLIFANENIEYSSSNFNLHRKEVIRYSIESNLSIAIANYNTYSNAGENVNFQMPKLKETEWEMVENEISIISFLQGLNIGGKVYNGYTVVTNNKNEEFVDEESIYITTDDGYYSKINDKNFVENEEFAKSALQGILDLDFETRRDGETGEYYIPKKGLASYSSVVGQEKLNTKYDTIYEYLQNTNIEGNVKKIYYTALARERWAAFKLENPSQVRFILDQMAASYDYLPITEAEETNNGKAIVTDGLIRYYDGLNIDGKKNTTITSDGAILKRMTEWKDLSGHHDGIMMNGLYGDEIDDNGLEGYSNGYVFFDGDDTGGYQDWVNIGQIKNLKQVTLEAKFELKSLPDTGSGYYLISNSNAGGIGLTVNSSGYPYFYIKFTDGNNAEVTGPKKLEINTVYHVFATYDKEKLLIYLSDGNEIIESPEVDATGTISEPTEETVMALGINPKGNAGTEVDTGCANINMYVARIYNRALSSEEINQNIGATKAGANSVGEEPETPEYIAPTIDITDLTISPNKFITPTTEPTLSAKVTVTNNGTAITSIKYAFTQSTDEPSTWSNEIETDGNTISTTVSGIANEEGFWYLHVKAKSGSEYATEYAIFESQITIDNQGPRITITDEDGVSGGTYEATDTEIKKKVTAADEKVAVTTLKAIYTTTEATPVDTAAWQDATSNAIMQLTGIGAGKTYYLHVIAEDENGNQTTAKYKYTVKSVETCNITINHTDGNTSHYTTNGATQSILMQKEIVVSSSTEIGLIQYALSASISNIDSISDGLWTNVSVAGATEKTISLSKSITVTNHVYLHVRVVDVDGNVIKTHTKTWTVGTGASSTY